MSDVVLIGYYGQANFGDDVLMTVAHGLARELVPGGSIAVRMIEDRTYVRRLLGDGIDWLPFGTRERHELILHGGGGTFFDFARNNFASCARNRMLLCAGAPRFVEAERAFRGLTGRNRLSARCMIGAGLGIGTFEPGSTRLLEALPVLSDMDLLWVRDPDSLANLAALGLSLPVIEGSDLAFLHEYWCPERLVMSARERRSARPRVGVCLRDWPSGSGETFADAIAPALRHLSAKFDLTLISLDRNTDCGTLHALRHMPQISWLPESMSIDEFAEDLASFDVLITSRAHAAICVACLGSPAVILEIEPKLAAVHAMLPNASRLAQPSSGGEQFEALICELLEVPLSTIAQDVSDNRARNAIALQSVRDTVLKDLAGQG